MLSLISALAAGGVAVIVTRMRIRSDREQQDETRKHDRAQLDARLAHERETEWRDRLVLAAADFSNGIQQAILGVRDVISAVSEKRDIEPASHEAQRRLDEALAVIGRIRLLFGDDSDTRRAAMALLGALDLARTRATSEDPTSAMEMLKMVDGLHAGFNRAAFEMISRPHWPVGSSLELRHSVADADDAPATVASP